MDNFPKVISSLLSLLVKLKPAVNIKSKLMSLEGESERTPYMESKYVCFLHDATNWTFTHVNEKFRHVV